MPHTFFWELHLITNELCNRPITIFKLNPINMYSNIHIYIFYFFYFLQFLKLWSYQTIIRHKYFHLPQKYITYIVISVLTDLLCDLRVDSMSYSHQVTHNTLIFQKPEINVLMLRLKYDHAKQRQHVLDVKRIQKFWTVSYKF